MFELEARLYRFNLGYLHRLIADIAPERLAVVHPDGGNSPLWILGHLAVSTDYAGRCLGMERILPKPWHLAFGPGSDPTKVPEPHPSGEELLAAIESGHDRVTKAATASSSEALDRPHNVKILDGSGLETLADMLAHLMTTHEAAHLGHLSAWRRREGKPPLL